jgi:hypothetical protein
LKLAVEVVRSTVSVAVHDTAVVPSGKVPDDGEQTMLGVPLSSLAEMLLRSTTAPEAEVASTVMSGVDPKVGESASAGMAKSSATAPATAMTARSRRAGKRKRAPPAPDPFGPGPRVVLDTPRTRAQLPSYAASNHLCSLTAARQLSIAARQVGVQVLGPSPARR